MLLYSSLELGYEPRIIDVSPGDRIFRDVLNNDWLTVWSSDGDCVLLALPAQEPYRTRLCCGSLSDLRGPSLARPLPAGIPKPLVTDSIEWDGTHSK